MVMAEIDSPQILQVFLDTRPLWPVEPRPNKKEEVQQLRIVASHELSLLTPEEQDSVVRFYHLRDAKLSLASHLLKHFVISKYCSTPWKDTRISRDSHGKPCYNPPSPQSEGVDFNVSHQAGLVSLIAAVGFSERVDVGTDITCWTERKEHDNKHIADKGLFDWIEMHADVFAESEVNWMKFGELHLDLEGHLQGYSKDLISRCERRDGSIEVEAMSKGDATKVKLKRSKIIDAKLRRFYTMWCLREAYVKMTGEALLASWLRELEILDIQAPELFSPTPNAQSLEQGPGIRAEKIVFKGTRLGDVQMEVSALGVDYMIAGCVRFSSEAQRSVVINNKWRQITLKDILP